MNIKFSRDGKEIGEFPDADVPSLLESGVLRRSDSCWDAAMGEWASVESVWPLLPRFLIQEGKSSKADASIRSLDSRSISAVASIGSASPLNASAKLMSLIKCPACQKDVSPRAPACPHCGEPLGKTSGISALPFLLVAFVVVLLVFVGNVHVITGGNGGLSLASRESFGFSEMFVNVDEITGMPWIAAKSRFPLGCALLQRKGIIESDEQMEQRIRDKAQKAIDEVTRRYR